MSEETLLACPFCGAEPILQEHPPHTHALQIGDWRMPDHPGSWSIECPACGCGMINATKKSVLEAWERRADREGLVCGDCDGSGWLENRVDGRHPCTCMTEAEPYQLLERQLETERLRLAACGCAALGYLDGCKEEYRSASLDDVVRLREQNTELLVAIKTKDAALRGSESLIADRDDCLALSKLNLGKILHLEQQNLALLAACEKMRGALSYEINFDGLLHGTYNEKIAEEALAAQPSADLLKQHDQQVIADFLEQSGQWVTNEASREERDRKRDAALLREVRFLTMQKGMPLSYLIDARESGEWVPDLGAAT